MKARRIGIPYTPLVKTKHGWVRVCPECGEKCKEVPDQFGELTTNNYGKHYTKAHKEN